MKKLMTAIAAVTAAFGLYAAAPATTGTSFEALDEGAFDWTKDDDGGDNASFWSYESDEVGTIKAYNGDAYTGTRPKQFDGGAQAKYLELDTSAPLTRYAATDKTAFVIEDTGLYFDQLVKFTAPSDADNVVDLAGGKIALWLKEIEADAATETAAATNLMITAGFFEAADTIKQNDYTAKINGADLVGKWARVTIKAIKITDTLAGFVVYIDGVAVTSDDSIGITPQLNPLGAKYETAKSLFPSAVITGTDKQTISAVSFNGSGAIDDVSFTAVVPDFAKDEIKFELDWNKADFASITAGGQELNVADGSTNLVLSGDTTSLKIEYTLATGRDCTVSLKAGAGAAIDPNDDMTFTFGGMASGSIVSKFNFFQVGDKTYPTFADALAAVTDVDNTISLKANCPLSAADVGDTGIAVNKAITLDLKGNDLVVNAQKTIFDTSAAITVVNSATTDAKFGMSEASAYIPVVALSEGGKLTVGTPDNQSNFVVVDGWLAEGASTDILIYQGKFDAASNSDNDDFYFDEIDGYPAVLDGGYWKVQKEQSEEPLKPGDEPVDLEVEPEATEEEAQAAADLLDVDVTDEQKDAGLTKDTIYAKAVRNEADTAWVAVVEIKPEFAPAVKEEASIEVTDENFGATVKEPVVGLYYGFVAVDALDGETDFAPVGTYKRATSTDPLKLTAPKGEGDARFYKLNASLFDRSVND